MESATFRKWLVEQGCRIDSDEHPRGHEGHVMVTVHREDRKTRAPLGGSRQALDPRVGAGLAMSLDSIHRNCRDRRVGSEMKR